ncbi:VanZ family protein [Virgibacillus siamensis]|uniref:VanZ family protein n=1 Tax=Virgibacillus siamensis TaxID=480071 RepID=UPI000984BAA3|nr:VanZ family protein [Virgibacillus siamensis]
MKKYIYWLLPLLWMGVIFYSSAQPYEEQNIKPFLGNLLNLSFLEPYLDWVSFTYHHSEVSTEVLGVDGLIEFFVRKGAHFGVYFILLLLFYLALKKTCRRTMWLLLALSYMMTITYAVTDEFHQGFTANRTPYAGDVVIDGIGAGFAICIVLLLHWKTKSGGIAK